MTTQLVKCPECGKSARLDDANKYRPFCSERCKLIDFGALASESYAVPGPKAEDELMSDDLPDRD